MFRDAATFPALPHISPVLPSRMPSAPSLIDHEAVKVVALQIGVREAARQFGLSEEMVMKWSQREKWFAYKELGEQALVRAQEERGLSAAVRTTPSDVLVRLGSKSKLVAAKVGHNTLKAIHRKKDDALIASASAFKATVDSLAKVHDWGQEGNSAPLVNINLLSAQLPEVHK